ncbi:MAG: adenylate/guanylate cyclase domain-containing protein [Gaiellaceae bacterium]
MPTATRSASAGQRATRTSSTSAAATPSTTGKARTAPRSDLPSGTVTFLFTDVEGSTRLLHELGAEAYAQALAEHRRVVRDAFARHGGVEVDTQGDAFFVAFPTAPGAFAAAEEILKGLGGGPIRLRMGLHTGTPHVTEEGYVGVDVHRAARIAASGRGGQVLVSAATAALVPPESLRDLGEHRLKDLSAPERIFQLGDAEYPELKTLYRTNLPVPATPFLGREQELGEVLELLGAARLLTLTGPGGTGKTRLGLQAAAEVSERFPDGVFWVPLAPLRDPQLVLEAAGQALGSQDGPAEHIADKRLLLMLDNFEHVVEAAGDVAGLLATCPNLQLLVTSRELLRVPGEQAYPVPPLEPEDGEELFLARARAARPDFAPTPSVRELCAWLDNLPLALELAAARVRVLSPEQLLERLSQRLDLLKAGRGADPRQQTLRATIEWSHELLDEYEQRLFARLAVFRGGCTLEAAEAVCDADLDTLESLVDKSLVRVRDGDRFWMLETIREYAEERLQASSEAQELQRRHARYFTELGEQAEPTLLGGDPVAWLDRLEQEHDNLRAVLDWAEGSGEFELGQRLGGAIWEFWCLRGHAPEGWRRLEALLRADERPTRARAKALTGSAHLAEEAGADSETQIRRAEESLELHRALGDEWGVAYGEFQYAGAIAESGDLARAQPLFAESIDKLQGLGDGHHALQARRALAWTHEELGDRERSKELHRENLELARASGNRLMEARSLGSLGAVLGDEGNLDESLPLILEAYRLDRELGDPGEISLDLYRLASALAAAGRLECAAELVACADAFDEQLGTALPSWGIAMRERTLAFVGEGQEAAAERGRSLTPDEAVELALSELQ